MLPYAVTMAGHNALIESGVVQEPVGWLLGAKTLLNSWQLDSRVEYFV